MANGKKIENNKTCLTCQDDGCCHCASIVFSKFLFGLGLLTLLFAWIAYTDGRLVLGFDSTYLFFNAIAFMLAANFFRCKP